MSFSILSIKIIVQFLGTFATFQEETNSFVLSVHSFARMENSAPTGPIVMKFDI
jgi:hypothetical protein